MMTLTIEVNEESEMQKVLSALRSLSLNDIKILSSPKSIPNIQKGNKKINPTDLFGIWKNNPKSLEEIRKTAWKRNFFI